jgi:phenylacetic acid degradation operon negative regulatory protein
MVPARRVGEELLDLFVWYLELVATRGRSLTWNHSFPNRQAYYDAVSRLRQRGLIAGRRSRDKEGYLELADDVDVRRRREFTPQKYWKQRWSGTWFVLAYDVPEANRSFRDALRGFLKRLRLGCFQRSVYVTPYDIRQEYSDLCEATGVQQYACLFETEGLFGYEPENIVDQAWDWDRLQEEHTWYLEICRENFDRVVNDELSEDALQNLAREEMSAYLAVMENDPLLPGRLLPPEYKGKEVFSVHRDIVRQIGKRL